MTDGLLREIVTEAVKIYIKEEEGAWLYGAKPQGNIPMELEKNLEGADIRINSAGTLHIERAEMCGGACCLYDGNDRELRIAPGDIEKLLDGEDVNATLEYGDDKYDVYVTIAHASDNQRIMRYMRDLQRGDRPIFGNSKITEK